MTRLEQIKKQHGWGDLTDDDFLQTQGKIDELAGRIQRRYGGSIEDIRRELEAM